MAKDEKFPWHNYHAHQRAKKQKILVMVKLRNQHEVHLNAEDLEGMFKTQTIELLENGDVKVINRCLNYDEHTEKNLMGNGMVVIEIHPARVVLSLMSVHEEFAEQYYAWRDHFMDEAKKVVMEQRDAEKRQMQAQKQQFESFIAQTRGPVVPDDPKN